MSKENNKLNPKSVVLAWVDAFNRADAEEIASLYSENAINHQVAETPVVGQTCIREMFAREFSAAKMVCIVENLFEDGEWAILESGAIHSDCGDAGSFTSLTAKFSFRGATGIRLVS